MMLQRQQWYRMQRVLIHRQRYRMLYCANVSVLVPYLVRYLCIGNDSVCGTVPAYVVLCLCIGNHNVCGIALILGRGAVCGTVLVFIHQQRYQCGLIEPICLRKNFMVLSVKRILSAIFALKKSWFCQLSDRHSNPKTHTLLYVIQRGGPLGKVIFQKSFGC